MMAAKLEWVSENRGLWTAGKWEIYVGSEGDYSVHVVGDGPFSRMGVHGSLADAKAWCEAQENAAAPVELPAVGVYGVPGEPDTWRRVDAIDVALSLVDFSTFHPDMSIGVSDWQSWVRESGAVRIDGEGSANDRELWELREYTASQREKLEALEAEVVRLRAKLDNEKLCRVYYQDIVYWVCNWIDQMRGGVRVECGSASEPCDGVPHALMDMLAKWQAVHGERDDLRAKLAALEKQYQACEDTVATEFERCGRLLAALRGIAGTCDPDKACGHLSVYQCAHLLRQLAEDAIKREEGGKS